MMSKPWCYFIVYIKILSEKIRWYFDENLFHVDYLLKKFYLMDKVDIKWHFTLANSSAITPILKIKPYFGIFFSD